MPPNISILSFKAYSPSTRQFRRVNTPPDNLNAFNHNSDEGQFSDDDELDSSSWPPLPSQGLSPTSKGPREWPIKPDASQLSSSEGSITDENE
jgi:hypothetical protein